jgi:hypothetical protein
MTETRAFPLADVLSITTGKLLSRRKMAGTCDVIVWLTRTAPFPRFMDEPTCRRLLAATAEARQLVTSQRPWLAELQPPGGIDAADLYLWLLAAETAYGEKITVTREGAMLSAAASAAALATIVGSATRATLELVEALNTPIEGD